MTHANMLMRYQSRNSWQLPGQHDLGSPEPGRGLHRLVDRLVDNLDLQGQHWLRRAVYSTSLRVAAAPLTHHRQQQAGRIIEPALHIDD